MNPPPETVPAPSTTPTTAAAKPDEPNQTGVREVRRAVSSARRITVLGSALAAVLAGTLHFGVPHASSAPCGVPGNLDCTAQGENGGGNGQGGGGDGGGGGGGGNNDPQGQCNGAACPQNPQDPAVVNTEAVAQAATDSVPWPIIEIHSAPAIRTYVRLETPFWLERDALGTPFREVRAKATVGDNVTIAQQTVTAIATPEMVTWTFGDGKTLDCHGAGKVEGLGDDVDCFHIYKMSSAHIGDGEKYTVEVDVSWSIAWTCAPVANCSAPAGVLPLHHEFDELLLAVGEIQTKAQ